MFEHSIVYLDDFLDHIVHILWNEIRNMWTSVKSEIVS